MPQPSTRRLPPPSTVRYDTQPPNSSLLDNEQRWASSAAKHACALRRACASLHRQPNGPLRTMINWAWPGVCHGPLSTGSRPREAAQRPRAQVPDSSVAQPACKAPTPRPHQTQGRLHCMHCPWAITRSCLQRHPSARNGPGWQAAPGCCRCIPYARPLASLSPGSTNNATPEARSGPGSSGQVTTQRPSTSTRHTSLTQKPGAAGAGATRGAAERCTAPHSTAPQLQTTT